MENSQMRSVNRTERGDNRVEDLHLDRVVASQPEIGPTPPDGGYGWLIVAAAVIYHITVPSVLTLYGLVILKAIREEDHEEGEVLRIWDVDVAMVPVIMIVMRLLLESWCRAVVKIFNMPRFMALSGLCMTVAGVLLSSYSTDAESNDHIVNVFAGIFAGAGCALTGQQTDVIVTHFFRDKLTIAQRLIKMAPSIGNCLTPVIIGYLHTIYTSDAVVMVYGAILMQNCLFLASFTRPIYIEKVIRSTYRMLRDAVEDEDEVIFSNNRNDAPTQNNTQQQIPTVSNPDDDNDVVVFKANKNAKEVIDPALENERRFSSDFTSYTGNPSSNRFSTDFGTLDISSYGRISGYQELESIERDAPQPLYRETTINTPENNVVFAAEVTPATARRTASLKKNFITIVNMLMDLNFYLYALLHLTTNFSIFVLGVLFPPLVWVQNPSMNIWSIASLVAVAHAAALSFIMLCIALPKSINEKARLCSAFCIAGAFGFYGVTMSGSKSFLVIWGMFASFSTAASNILLQPLYNSTLNEFDSTATVTSANTLGAAFIMLWCVAYNYSYAACFMTACGLQAVTAAVFLLASFRRRR